MSAEWGDVVLQQEKEIVELKTTIKAIRELPDKWRKYSFDNPEATEYMDSDDCADELEALLPEKDDGS